MSTDNWDSVPGLVAGASFAGMKYRFAKLSNAGAFNVVPCSVLGEAAIGVAYDDVPNVGESITIANEGVVKVVASAIIAVAANISTAADGRAVTSATGNMVLGKALTAATTIGDIISVQLVGPFTAP
jgi:hypothetical protein